MAVTRTSVYVDENMAERVRHMPRTFNVSAILRVMLAAGVMLDDKEFSEWLKADKKRMETFQWIREKVGSHRKLDL